MISVSICSPSRAIAEQWNDLVGRASSNVFMDPTALFAASEMKFARVQMLLAWEEGATPARLVGVWALQLRKVAPFWPVLLEALPYNYSFLSSPVVDPAFVTEVIPAFFSAVAGSTLPNVLSLRDFDATSPSYAALVAALAARGRVALTLAQDDRPVVSRDAGIKRSGSTRKKLRQDWNRVAALGTVDVINDRAPDAVRQAFEAFLALEAASWKGTQGTALLSNSEDAAFVRRMVGDLADRHNASVALLRIDGQVIAAQVVLYCGATAYTWKTAYDQQYARYSPGALLVDKVTEALFATPGIDAIDSCSDGAGFMAQLWSGRRPMVDLLIDVGAGSSMPLVMEAWRRRTYYQLRALRNRLRSGKRRREPRPAATGAVA
jgi:CelD/BcsL family acetyltransferase involved in cellulose biosynthesis